MVCLLAAACHDSVLVIAKLTDASIVETSQTIHREKFGLVRLLWIACGTDDRLIESNRKFKDWLKSKHVNFVPVETPGAHTWLVWRRNLAEFASQIFAGAKKPS